MPQYHIQGWKRQPRDDRDRPFRATRRLIASLPATHDLSESVFGDVPQMNQGNLGSCGPNTASEDSTCDWLAEGYDLKFVPSRLFIYYVTRMLMGTVNQDSGVDNRSMMKALAQYGYCFEDMLPYADDPLTFRKKPSAACFAAALSNRILGYSAVQVSLDDMKAALYVTGRPVVFGFDVFNGMMGSQAEETGIVPDPKSHEMPIGGHDVSLIGWDDNKQLLKFRNHWIKDDGSPWGDNGCGYFSYKFGTNSSHVSDLWVIDAVAPKPAPIPIPAPPSPSPTPTVRVPSKVVIYDQTGVELATIGK